MSKQIAIVTKAHLDCLDELYDYFFFCPNCNVSNLLMNFSYCPICGIKLEWDDKVSEICKPHKSYDEDEDYDWSKPLEPLNRLEPEKFYYQFVPTNR